MPDWRDCSARSKNRSEFNETSWRTIFYLEGRRDGAFIDLVEGYRQPTGPKGNLGSWAENRYRIRMTGNDCVMTAKTGKNTNITIIYFAYNTRLKAPAPCQF